MILSISIIGGVLLLVSLYVNYNLLRKVEKLEGIANNQQKFIDDFESIIMDVDTTISEIDSAGTFQSDDEIGVFFDDVKLLRDKIVDYRKV